MIRYGATTLQPNTWYNIAGVYDAATQTLHVYLNGQLDDGLHDASLYRSHSFTARPLTSGNTTTTSAVTATINGQVDTTPPTETISTTINTDTGATTTITSGGVTKDNTLGLSGTVSDAGGVSSVQIYDGATLLGPATVSSGNWSYTTPALLDGSHSFTAKATDNAGNTTTTSAVTATVGRDAADRDDQHHDQHGYGRDHHHHQRGGDEGQHPGPVRHGERCRWGQLGADL